MCWHDPLPTIIDALMADNGFDAGILPRVLQDTRRYVQQLRRDYRKIPCKVDYSDPYVRGAYMLAYFPYYIEPIYTVLSRAGTARTLPVLNKPRVSVCAFGSGPTPEALGVMAYLKERCPDCAQAHFSLMDAASDGWEKCVSLCFDQLQPDYWDGRATYSLHRCDLLGQCEECRDDCEAVVKEADLVIMQNCLNDVIADPDKAIDRAVTIVGKMKQGALFVCIDLNFTKIQRALQTVAQKVTSAGLGDVAHAVARFAHQIRPSFHIPPLLMDHLYTGEDGLVAKRHVRFYALGLRRTAWRR